MPAVGYLSYDARCADLFFDVVTRRYEEPASIVLFAEWPSVFPNAACVVPLVDRLVHRSEFIAIDGSSYRLKAATERAAAPPPRRSRAADHSTGTLA